jgi:hypothetical protein
LHILINLHDLFLLESGLWLNNIMWHKWVSLILPKAPHTSHRVGRWVSLKAFGEVTDTTWAIEGTIQGTLSFFAKFLKTRR